jgi:uncharacterized protein
MKKEFTAKGADGRPFSLDISYDKPYAKKPLVIFSHGFKGFKDWGHFNLVAEEFTKHGFAFIKFNFSHNGTTLEDPKAFTDLETFGRNNFSKEVEDLGAVIGFVLQEKEISDLVDPEKIFLIGHSRGGAITLIKTAEDKRVKKAVTWASISNTERWMNPPSVEEWKTNGVIYAENSRTKQMLPLYYQFREDFYRNKERLDLVCVCAKLETPVLLVHGTEDATLPVTEALDLHARIKNAQLKIIDGGDHAFGGKEPWTDSELPPAMKKCIDATIEFLK